MNVAAIPYKYKVAGGIWLIFVLFSIITALSYINTSSLAGKAEARKRSSQSIVLLKGIYADLTEMDTATTDFVASGAEDDLKAFGERVTRMTDRVAELQTVMAFDPEQKQSFESLQSLFSRQIEFDGSVIEAYQEKGPFWAARLMHSADAEQLSVDLKRSLFSLMDMQKERFLALDSAVSANAKRTVAVVFAGNLLGSLVAMLSLILARREFEKRKRSEESGRSFQVTASQTSDLVIVTDTEGAIEFANKAVEETTGYPVSKLVGKNAAMLRSGDENEALLKKQEGELLSGRPIKVSTLKRKKDGSLISLEETVTPVRDPQGEIARFVSTGKDVTHQKALEENVHQLTYYDSLTGLPRRTLFIDRLSKELERVRGNHGALAVFLIAVDRFKQMTEMFGLDAGDEILKLVAERMVGSLGASEGTFLARLGSDEFAAILRNIETPADVMRSADRLLKFESQPTSIRGQEVLITVAAGIAMSDGQDLDAYTIVKNADAALSQAKAQGRNNYQFYAKDLDHEVAAQLAMEKNLFSALVNKEYLLNYQPYHDLITKNIAGAEALIKWKHPALGLVSPVEFIPTLEHTGMIIDVGEWVLRTACSQLKEWDARRALFPVSVNLSGVQFRHKYLVTTIDNAIKDFNVNPTHLTLELTESIFMHDLNFAQGILKKLKNLGVAISVDDFGTGYSSLSYLKKLPVDVVKIDKSFVNDVTTDPDAAAIVTAITSMARSLNLKTIAEGVETEEQAKILRLLRCDIGQGYYFNPALPPAELEKYLY